MLAIFRSVSLTYVNSCLRRRLSVSVFRLKIFRQRGHNHDRPIRALGGFTPKQHLTSSNINIAGPQRVAFYKFSAWFHLITHQHGEHAVGFDGVIDLYPE